MVPSSNIGGTFIAFEGDDFKEDELGLSKEVLGRKRKRRGININGVLDANSQLETDQGMFTKVQNNCLVLPNAQQTFL